MTNRSCSLEPDELLRAFFEANEGPEAEGFLSTLISSHAEPVIRGILGQRGGPWGRNGSTDAFALEDLHSQALLQLLARLRDLKTRREAATIGGFLDYVAVTTYHTYHDWLRARYPQRHRLKSKLRYVLSRASGLAIWAAEADGWLCGLAAWRGRPRRTPAGPDRAAPSWPPPRAWIEGRPADFLIQLFQRAGGPLEIDELVETVAGVCGIPRDPWVPEAAAAVAQGSQGRADPVAEADDRIFLGQLWAEIRRLPLRQRRALLLNLRDGHTHNVVALLPLTGVATLRQIAETLEMPAEELARLWGELPLDDQALAQSMGLQRQQVINLRAAARRRLARRMSLTRPLDRDVLA